MDVWAEIDAERKELLALLETLDEAQWDAPSLCAEWRVRDVVAHLVAATEVAVGSFLGGMVKNGMNINRFLANDARERGSRPVPEVLDQFRGIIGRRSKPPVVGPLDVLTDSITHQQDIRRALGASRQVPFDRLKAAADHIRSKQPVIGAKKRVRGLALRATDTDWASGQGAEVSGPMEALFMAALMGRPQALGELSGPGTETLAARL